MQIALAFDGELRQRQEGEADGHSRGAARFFSKFSSPRNFETTYFPPEIIAGVATAALENLNFETH